MKRMRKLVSLLLAVVMVLAMVVPTSAAGNGSITIDNAVVDQTYSVYKIFDLESYDATAGTYAYKTNSTWKSFAESAATYVIVDQQGYVTWVEGADAAAFAKAALAYAKANGISAENTNTADSATVSFTGLELGYYLVDSSLGALCSLDTTNPNVTIKEKNAQPTIEKEVKEDSTGTWGDTNDADITQEVQFQATITAQAGAENYVMHDKMSTGLTFKSVSGITLNDTLVAASNYTVKTSDLADSDCTFEIVFTKDFCDTLNANDRIVVSYTATLNANAVIAGSGNPNDVQLTYGDNNSTNWDETVTYTWDMDVFKYTLNGQNQQALANAKFTLSKNADGTDPIKLTAVAEQDNTYRVDDQSTVTEITTDVTGAFTIRGLDADTYYLTETAAPAGYNKLSEPITVKIEEKNEQKGVTVVNNAAVEKVEVENNSGTELPSTGGIGTTIFYVIGTILVLGAAILLITKKRMNAEK